MKAPVPFKILLTLALLAGARVSALEVSEVTDVAAKVDEAPVPVRTTAPTYPRDLKDAEVQGVVMVVTVIDESGAVIACEIGKTSNEGFNDVALEAIRKWRFKPAKVAGKTVKVKVTIPIRFTT